MASEMVDSFEFLGAEGRRLAGSLFRFVRFSNHFSSPSPQKSLWRGPVGVKLELGGRPLTFGYGKCGPDGSRVIAPRIW